MTSSYAQKKSKTLATRKKTKKRRAEDKTEISTRFHQPPHLRDPRWKSNCHETTTEPPMEPLTTIKSDSGASLSESKKSLKMTETVILNCLYDTRIQNNAETIVPSISTLNQNDFQTTEFPITSSIETSIACAKWFYQAIRKQDTRQKSTVILLIDSESMLTQLPGVLGLVKNKKKSKSRYGIGSANKSTTEYKGFETVSSIRQKEVPERVLKQLKNGQIWTIATTINSIDYWKEALGTTSIHYFIPICSV